MYNNEMNKCEMECVICYNNMDGGDKDNKWECSHYFHKKCISNWDKSCPVCRCDKRKDTYKYVNKCFDIKYFISWASKITYDVSNYNKKWKSPKCIQDNHNIQYYSEYKPYGICHNCSIVQSFCYEP